MTDGAFEITLYPVKKLWGFKEEGNRVPADEEITKALTLVGSDKVSVDEAASDQESAEGQNAIVFAQPGMEIDLGGIAKGYTSASVIRIFEAHNVKGLVNLGGNVQACGTKPDGSDWRVAVRKPESREDDDIQWFDAATKEGKALTRAAFLGIVETNDEAVITSGGYERYFEQDGKVYQHILDPKTGRPSESDTVSVTIVCKDGALADGLSTSLFVMGTEKATKLWRSGAAEFEMILLDKQGKLYVTEGLRDRFSSDLKINWISK
jgi:thiamine biosynthesis lipoprotein